MTDHGEKAAGKPDAAETAAPAGMMERASCRCAEMIPRMMAMCAGPGQGSEVAEPTESAATGSEEGLHP